MQRYCARTVTLDGVIEDSVRTRVWRNGVLEAENFPFEQISDYLEQPDCLVWADVCAPDSARINALAEELSLDPHAVEDATAPNERPKATHYATHTFLTAYALYLDKDTAEVQARRISAFAVKRAFVTVRQNEDFDIEPVIRAWD
jgi:magnesium transporter